MSCFILENIDTSSINNFSIIREIILHDKFEYFLEAYRDMIENFDLYADVNSEIYNNTGNYIKIKIHTSNWFDAYIIFWGPEALSPIHDHAENGCLYKVIKGSLREHIYSNVNVLKIDEKDILENEIGEIDNTRGYHSMENLSNSVSVSVHFYSPAGYQMNVF